MRAREEQWTDVGFAARGIETAEQWWDALAAEPAVAPLLTERIRRFAGKQRQDTPPGFTWRRCATPASARWTRSGRRSRTAWC
jgi:hypothetical protein